MSHATMRARNVATTLMEAVVPARPHKDIEVKYAAAIHESGDALVGHLLDHEVYKVSILKSYNSHVGLIFGLLLNSLLTNSY